MKTHVLLIFTFLIGSHFITAQTVTTFTDGTPDDAIAIDSNGNIYCSNYVGDTVFKFTPSGDVSSFITGLNTPNGLAFNSNGDLYVCDGQGNMVYKYDSNGMQLAAYPKSGHPSGIIKAFDSDEMYFTTYTENKIYTLATDGTITELSSAPELNGPVGLAMDENGTLYAGNYTDREIYRVLANGDVEYIATVPTDGGAYPNLGFITYGQGMLWGTSMGSDKIYAINPNGVDEVFLFAGSTQGSNDGDISQATFFTPNGILFNDAEDTMYITDFGTKNLRIISGVVLGIQEMGLKKSEVILYPNPATDLITVSALLPSAGDYGIVVRDILGKEIITLDGYAEASEISETINVSQWSSGTYLIEVIFESYSIIKKMVK